MYMLERDLLNESKVLCLTIAVQIICVHAAQKSGNLHTLLYAV